MTVLARVVQRLATRRLETLASFAALLVYCLVSGPMLLRQSQAPQFVYQAAGFLQGTLAIPGEPPNLNDWVRFGDHWYSSFPPFPAVLMLPFVALHGLAFNDTFFTVCVAAFNVGLFVAFLRRLRDDGQHDRSDRDVLLLAAFFAFGSVYFYSSIRGEVWFTAHVVGVGLTLLYLLSALRARRPWLAGLALGLAAVTRANLVYAVPFFALEALVPDGRLPTLQELPARVRTALPALLRFALPLALVLAFAFWMNYARFGRWNEFGHALMFNNRVNERIRRYGLFNPHFLAENLRSAFLLLPTVQLRPLRVGFDGNGMSMLVTTPLLALLPFAARRSRSTLALATTALAVALPGLLYMNNGWFQFGYRFSIDYLPYLFALLAIGGLPTNRWFVALGAAGCAVSTWGALVFNRFF